MCVNVVCKTYSHNGLIKHLTLTFLTTLSINNYSIFEIGELVSIFVRSNFNERLLNRLWLFCCSIPALDHQTMMLNVRTLWTTDHGHEAAGAFVYAVWCDSIHTICQAALPSRAGATNMLTHNVRQKQGTTPGKRPIAYLRRGKQSSVKTMTDMNNTPHWNIKKIKN